MTVTIRPGTREDLFGAFVVFRTALQRLNQSLEMASAEDAPDPADLVPFYDYFRLYSEHLLQTAEHFTVAEEGHEIIGFARSIRRDNVLQLTELFVHPDRQSQGLGKRLLEAAFPADGETNRTGHRLPGPARGDALPESGGEIPFRGL